MGHPNYSPGSYPLGSGSVDPDPWPGGVAPPMGDPGPASGEARLSVPNAVVPRPVGGLWSNVCQWRSNGSPRPLVLTVQLASNVAASAAAPFAAEALLLSQVSGNAMGTAKAAGVLRVTYGQGNTLRVIEADLRSGSYQLPSCDLATVDVLAFGQGPIEMRVQASLMVGLHPLPSRFASSVRATLAAAASVVEKVPFGARWVAISGGAPTGIGAGQPVYSLAQGPAGLYLVHNFVDGVFLSQPGQPVELSSREDVTLTNGGSASGDFTIKFFLET